MSTRKAHSSGLLFSWIRTTRAAPWPEQALKQCSTVIIVPMPSFFRYLNPCPEQPLGLYTPSPSFPRIFQLPGVSLVVKGSSMVFERMNINPQKPHLLPSSVLLLLLHSHNHEIKPHGKQTGRPRRDQSRGDTGDQSPPYNMDRYCRKSHASLYG